MLLAVLAYAGKIRSRASWLGLLSLAVFFLSLPSLAQEQGPLQPAAPQEEDYPSQPAPRRTSPPPQQARQLPPQQQSPAPKAVSSGLSKDAPSIPVDQIIQKFAAREAEFKEERDNFTYVQDFVIQTVTDSGRVDGEYEMTSDITFTPDGKRYEQITYAPQPTLERIMLSQQDLDDLRNVQPFVLTTAELPKYDVTYVGREMIDEIPTYVFDVGPKRLEKNQRYFQGRIWVDAADMEIVKTYGKAVPDIRKGSNENVFPRFETYRENIEGNYWFPTYTHSEDVLHFRTEDVRIRMTVHYTDYKRFRVSIKLLNTEPASQPTPAPPQKP